MAPQQLAALYNDLQRAFDARPSNFKRCGSLLAQLKVLSRQSPVAEASFCFSQIGLIEAGLLLPTGDPKS
jgi:26S proteasome regulatory subunit N12